MKRLPVRVIGTALTLLVVAGCNSDHESSEGARRNPHVNMQEAAGKADALVHETLSTVKPPSSGLTTSRITAVVVETGPGWGTLRVARLS